jgi:hypothetical protein
VPDVGKRRIEATLADHGPGAGVALEDLACHGHVTKADYEKVPIPDVEKRLAHNDKVRIYYETAPDFAGVDPGAVWDDTKVGFAHWFRWERLAVSLTWNGSNRQ